MNSLKKLSFLYPLRSLCRVTTEESLILKASQTGQAYAVDVMESIRSGKAAITRNYILPAV